MAREAEILREKLAIEADAEALRRRRVAEGEAEAIQIRAEAEAAAARMQMEVEAEAGGTHKLAEALRELDEAGLLLKIEEIRAEAAIEASPSFAEAFKNNSKVFLPSFGIMGTVPILAIFWSS
ncbi:MAG: hypothetical protein ACFFB3_12890 [Candidatus Hodarchaeota archaeon]